MSLYRDALAADPRPASSRPSCHGVLAVVELSRIRVCGCVCSITDGPIVSVRLGWLLLAVTVLMSSSACG